MYAYQWWADTTTGLLKLRNSANSAWISLRELDGTLTIEDGTAAAPGLAFTSDLNTGLLRVGADQLAITTGGTSRLAVSTTAVSSTLAVDVPLGAVGTPSITFTGDLNTGLFSPGADQVAISTGGTGRVFVDASGNVGINGSAANYVGYPNLRINGSSGGILDLCNNGTSIFRLTGDTTGAYYYTQNASYPHVWGAGASERARIDSSGRLLVGVAANANGGILQLSSGITFPATAVAASDANTLDDYEEGTFTPTVIGSTTAGTATYSTQTGIYTKVGRLVTVSIFLGWSGGTGTGSLQFTGLPFTVSGSSYSPVSIGYVSLISLTALNYILGYGFQGTSRIDFVQYPTGGGSLSDVPYDVGGAIMVTCSYIV